ncbi:PucR family transcriptional regulator [Mycolicibacterium goodii]|uniref:PucR family transcriptional regulator n=1 Tax=Mycolicibacterium goodii TaxID=134601 RepID=A0ABS6HLT4_MYCGD|nr:PucR family transcriptional regulator [Mycolicibacterium goodii]MBU8822639.1 PucR family transcriptional regulator [Mycolicibacterium goodii]MBU8835088.1 PucR family transcriptional regulator [Mycolicibacterium goodii]OKH76043.1 PucR family transcriptional regulator [Mycobacterium sp. SWH-M5]
MIPTVRDVIDLPVVQAGDPEVVSAENLDCPVRWVHVSDMPDLAGLLHGGELVLTTGAGLSDAPHDYLERMSRAGAVGLVVELGTRVSHLPGGVGDVARALGLPLVLLHRQTRFVEITEAVHRLIVADQYEELAFAHRTHETFTDLSMRRASLADIVRAAADMINESVVLEDLSHQVLAISPRGEAATTVLAEWQRRSRAMTEPWITTAVGPRSEEWGRLIIPRTPAAPARAKTVLERAAQALALHRMAERGRSGLEHQAQSGLIDDVVGGRIADDREAAARAEALGLRAGGPYLPVTVRTDPPAERLDPVGVQRRNIRVLDAVTHSVRSQGHTAICSIRRDGEVGFVLALTPRRNMTADAALTRLAEGLREAITRSGVTTKAVVAVANNADTFADAVHGLREAAHIAEVALPMAGTERLSGRAFVRASDVRLRGLITLLQDDPRVQTFAETELRTLLIHDADHGEDDMAVLRGYLESAGNKSALAKRLHMSRPALYSRLAAIQRRLGVDLDDGESMTSLHVALLILDTQRSASPEPAR